MGQNSDRLGDFSTTHPADIDPVGWIQKDGIRQADAIRARSGPSGRVAAGGWDSRGRNLVERLAPRLFDLSLFIALILLMPASPLRRGFNFRCGAGAKVDGKNYKQIDIW
jgi:hypothetical protein